MEFLDTKENPADRLDTKFGKYMERISDTLDRVEENTDRYQMYAKKLGLSWHTEISNKGLEDMQDNIFKEMAQMTKNIETADIHEDMDSYVNYEVALIEKSAYHYNDANFERQVRKELNAKVEGILRQAQISDIDKEIINLENTKIGLIGKVLGRAREIELKKEQLTLIKRILKNDSGNEVEDCSVNEIMAKILYYKKQHDGNLPEELYVVASQIESVFEIDENEVEKIANIKYNSQLPTVQNGNNPIFRRKSNRNLQQQNQRLEEELQMIDYQDRNQYRTQSKFSKSATDNLRDIYFHMKNIQNAIRRGRELQKFNNEATIEEQ